MLRKTPRSRTVTTILSPGQRFQCSDGSLADLTVARLITDRMGLLHVTLRADDGHEISAFAQQIESAISDGHLTPLLTHSFVPSQVAC